MPERVGPGMMNAGPPGEQSSSFRGGESSAPAFDVGKETEATEAKRTRVTHELDETVAVLKRAQTIVGEQLRAARTDDNIADYDTISTDIQNIERSRPLVEHANDEELDAISNYIVSARKRLQRFIELVSATPEEVNQPPQEEAPADEAEEANQPENIETTETTETVDDAEEEDTPETERTEEEPTEEEKYRAHQTLGALAANISPSSDEELNRRITEALRNQNEEPPELTFELISAIVNKLRPSWNGEQKERYENLNPRVILAETVALMTRVPENQEEANELFLQQQEFDYQVRHAVVEYVVAERTKDIREKIKAEVEKLKKKSAKNSKVMNFVKGALVAVGGGVAGSALRQLFNQIGIPAAAHLVAGAGAVTATRALSGVSGALAGGIVGGVIGGITGYRRSRSEVFSYGHIDAELKKLRAEKKELTRSEEVALLIKLAQEKKLTGQDANELEVAYQAIERYYHDQAADELKAALFAVESDESAEQYEPQQNLARALTALLDAHRDGSESNKTENINQFIIDRQKEITKKTWRSIGRGALTGAGLGGIMGVLFPSSSLVSQVNTEATIQNHTLEPLARMISSGNVVEAQHLAGKLHIDIGAKYEGGSLYQLAHQLVTGPNGEFVNNENNIRALHHLLSHPDQVAPHLDQLKDLLANQGVNGHDFTWRVLHGELGGQSAQDLARHVFDHYKDSNKHDIFARSWYHSGNWIADAQRWISERAMPLGSENEWEHFLAFLTASWGARFTAGHGWEAVDRIEKTALEHQNKIDEDRSKEKRSFKPKTQEEFIDPRIFKLKNDKEITGAERERLEQERMAWARKLKALHGFFFFKKDAKGNTRAYRMWPLKIHSANPRKYQTSANGENNPDAGHDVVQNDPDAVYNGKFYVKEYDLKSLYRTTPDGKYQFMMSVEKDKADRYRTKKFADTWDVPEQWRPIHHEAHQVSWEQIFEPRGKLARQVFISPYEADKYAYSINELGLRAGERRKDIDKYVYRAKPGDKEGPPEDGGDSDDQPDDKPQDPTKPTPPPTPETPKPEPTPTPTPETDPKPPTKPFDPVAELKTILSETAITTNLTDAERRRRSVERRHRLAEYRQRLADQKEGLAELHESVLTAIRQHPEMGADDLKKMVRELGQEINMNPTQLEAAEKAIDGYIERHRFIKELRAEYPDDAALFEAIFNHQPAGKIEVVQGPMTLLFKCHDVNDFVYVRSHAYLTGRTISAQDIDRYKKLAGCAMTNDIVSARLNKTVPGGTILLESVTHVHERHAALGYSTYEAGAKALYEHEEQHAINNLFARQENLSQAVAEIKEATTDAERQEAMKRYFFRDRQVQVDTRAADELIAHFRLENSTYTPEKLFKTMATAQDNDGGYDYVAQSNVIPAAMRALFARPEVDPQYRSTAEAIAKPIYGELYHRTLRRSIDSYFKLRQAGYSLETSLALLTHEPLTRWHGAVNRLLEEQRGEFHSPYTAERIKPNTYPSTLLAQKEQLAPGVILIDPVAQRLIRLTSPNGTDGWNYEAYCTDSEWHRISQPPLETARALGALRVVAREAFEKAGTTGTTEHEPLNPTKLESIREFARRAELESKETYLESVNKAIETLRNTEGIVELRKDVPTVVIPDLHGRREFLAAALSEVVDGKSVLELLKDGKINVVCIGDGMHTEDGANWSPRARMLERNSDGTVKYDSNNRPILTPFGKLIDVWEKAIEKAQRKRKAPAGSDITDADNNDPAVKAAYDKVAPEWAKVEAEMMNTEMTRSLGLMKMVMDLKAQYPDAFHFIRGNHDDIMGGFRKYANESDQVRNWVNKNFGNDFLTRYAQFEDSLPLMVIGNKFVASHTAPSEPFTREIISQRDNVVSGKTADSSGHRGGLTWTDNTDWIEGQPSGQQGEQNIDTTLANINATGSNWIIGHRRVSENDGRYRSQFNNKLIQINNPREWVMAVIPKGRAINPETDIKKIGPIS